MTGALYTETTPGSLMTGALYTETKPGPLMTGALTLKPHRVHL